MTTPTAPNAAMWVIAGNNLVLRGALPRRVFRIVMANVDKPDQRPSTKFKHPDLLAWVIQERPRLLAAAFLLYRYWLSLRCPPAQPLRQLASFESWSKMIGGVLACVDIPSFLETAHEQMAEMDPSRDEWVEYVNALAEKYPNKKRFRVSDIWVNHYAGGNTTGLDPVFMATPSDIAAEMGRPNAAKTRLGNALNERRGRVFGTYKLQRDRAGVTHGTLFFLEKVEN